MPSETFHATHQGPRPGEQVTESGIILPAGVGRPRNLRGEPVSFDNTKGRSDTYNAQGIDSENPYNAFATQAEGTIEAPINSENSVEATTETHDKVLKEVTAELDRQRGMNTELLNELEELKRRFATLEASVNQASLPNVSEVTAPINPVANKEVELYQQPEVEKAEEEIENPFAGKELELYQQPEVKNVENEGSKEVAPSFEVVISEEMQKALQDAQDRYATVTAKNRNAFMGHLLHNSNYLAKIKPLQAMADKLNKAQDEKELGPAREQYKQALRAIQNEISTQIISEFGSTPESTEDIRMNAADVAIQSEVELEMKIAAARMEQSGDTNKFVNWWVRQKGLGGKFLKAGVVAGVGVTTGLIVGLAGAPIVVGTALGAGAGAAIGLYTTKRRANAITEKGGYNTLAEQQAQEDLTRKAEFAAEQRSAEGGFVTVDSLVNFTEDRTGNEKKGNRARVKSAAAAGAIGGSIGGIAGSGIRQAVEAGLNQQSTDVVEKPVETEVTEKPEAPTPEAPELQGTSFEVQSGSSYTQELMEFAKANGHSLTPDQSFQLHQDIMGKFGADYIDINGAGNDIYGSGGDVRLAEAGKASWNEGVGQFIQQWMANRGL